MDNNTLSYILTLSANICFAFASLIFTNYSKKISSLFMNTFKAFVTFIFLTLTMLFVGGFSKLYFVEAWPLILSGFIGLGIGDIFLLSAFARIGPGRTLIIFGFQPVIMALASYFLFNQQVKSHHIWAMLLMMICLFLFSYEGKRESGRWEVKGLILALIGFSLDASGILLSRYGFDRLDNFTHIQGHFYRTFGALISYLVLRASGLKIGLISNFIAQPFKGRIALIAGGFFGTFLSLLLFLHAVKIGHLASLSSIAITGPIFATLFECIYLKKKPSLILCLALFIFCLGFSILFSSP